MDVQDVWEPDVASVTERMREYDTSQTDSRESTLKPNTYVSINGRLTRVNSASMFR